jgi:hypothetical protein
VPSREGRFALDDDEEPDIFLTTPGPSPAAADGSAAPSQPFTISLTTPPLSGAGHPTATPIRPSPVSIHPTTVPPPPLSRSWACLQRLRAYAEGIPRALAFARLGDRCGTEPLSAASAAELMVRGFAFMDDAVKLHYGSKRGGAAVACARVNGRARTLTVAHAGDCRVILIRNGRVIRATRDHVASDPMECAEVRSRGGLVLDVDGCARYANNH